jgi:hypothetical protein
VARRYLFRQQRKYKGLDVLIHDAFPMEKWRYWLSLNTKIW